MEFHTLAPTTGVDVPGIIVDFTLGVAAGKTNFPQIIKVPNFQDCY
jgi:hypothetical protein